MARIEVSLAVLLTYYEVTYTNNIRNDNGEWIFHQTYLYNFGNANIRIAHTHHYKRQNSWFEAFELTLCRLKICGCETVLRFSTIYRTITVLASKRVSVRGRGISIPFLVPQKTLYCTIPSYLYEERGVKELLECCTVIILSVVSWVYYSIYLLTS